jgi:hypothetical protein
MSQKYGIKPALNVPEPDNMIRVREFAINEPDSEKLNAARACPKRARVRQYEQSQKACPKCVRVRNYK